MSNHQYLLDHSWLIPNSIPDGKVCLNESGELAVTKFAVEPVSYLRHFECSVLNLRRSGTCLVLLRDLASVISCTRIQIDSLLYSLDEGSLRRSLFEHTGGSYPELITRGDIKVFLPPIGKRLLFNHGIKLDLMVIGGLTVYCFGDPAKMSDESVRLALRVHDEVNIPQMPLLYFKRVSFDLITV